MKLKLKKICCATLAAAMMLVSAVSVSAEENNKASQKETTVYIVGDSTACIYGSDDDYAIPRAGWGMYFDSYLNDNAEVVDLALAGRSSKSFTIEDNYKTLYDDLKEGDFLLIQFGHNDAKSSTEEDLQNRYTDPEGATDEEGSFKNSLYTNYIKIAQEKGATPILLSPVSRRKYKEGKVTDSHGMYDDAVRELAQELDVELIDATKLTEDVYNAVGFDGARYFHAVYNDMTKGEYGYDNTHYSHSGAIEVCALIAEAAEEDDLSIAEYINDDVEASKEKAQELSRGYAASFLARLIGAEEEDSSNFSDVSEENENFDGISKAKKAEIVLGDENGNFKPNDDATMLQVYLMASRALQNIYDTEEADTSIFDNSETIKDYAKKDLAILVENDIITVSDAEEAENILADKSALEEIACKVYDVRAAQVNAEAEAEQSLDELEKVEDTK